jgi:membrane protein DedA with SNARE-associated domain
MISLPAGLARMGHIRFLLYTFAGATIWNAVLISAGMWLGENFADIEQWTGPVTIACVILMVAIYAWRVMTWRPRTRD